MVVKGEMGCVEGDSAGGKESGVKGAGLGLATYLHASKQTASRQIQRSVSTQRFSNYRLLDTTSTALEYINTTSDKVSVI